jgi:hypothetical protein
MRPSSNSFRYLLKSIDCNYCPAEIPSFFISTFCATVTTGVCYNTFQASRLLAQPLGLLLHGGAEVAAARQGMQATW